MDTPDFKRSVQNDMHDLKEMYRGLGVDIDTDANITDDPLAYDVVKYERLNDNMRRTLIGHGKAIVDKINDHFLKTGELSEDLQNLRYEATRIMWRLSYLDDNEPPKMGQSRDLPDPSL